jgi:hypothetical protein
MEKVNYRIVQTEPNEFILQKQIWVNVESSCNLEDVMKLLDAYTNLPHIIYKSKREE